MIVYTCPRCGGTLAVVRQPSDPPWSVYLPATCTRCRIERSKLSAAELVAAILREIDLLRENTR